MRISIERSMLALCFVAAACGDPIVDGRYQGDVLVSLRGVVCGTDMASLQTPTSVGIAWTTIEDRSRMIAASLGDVRPFMERTLPAEFELPIFDPPPASILQASATGLVIGIPLFFEDGDGNGTMSIGSAGVVAPDRLLGVSTRHVILETEGRYDLAEVSCAGHAEIDQVQPTGPNSAVDIALLFSPASPTAMPTSEDRRPSECLRSLLGS